MGAQPTPKALETRLAVALSALDPARPVVLEAESAKVGNLTLPHALWQAMTRAPRIALDVPLPERAAYLARAYADVTTDPARLSATLDRLRPYHAADRIADWQAMAGAGAFADLAAGLMADHYDPRYRKHRARMAVPVTDLAAESLTPDALPALAARIAALIPRLTATGDLT
jgi:tRNA 2-selenouridine synthase